MSSNKNNKFYDQQLLNNIERVILAEEITLPELPDGPLTLSYLEKYGEYKLAFNEYKDMKGKFYIKVLTPTVDNSGVANNSNLAPNTTNHKGTRLNVSGYSSSNYITLTIPKYIVLQFKKSIPKGTEFIIASVGGSLNVDEMRIIGLYTI